MLYLFHFQLEYFLFFSGKPPFQYTKQAPFQFILAT